MKTMNVFSLRDEVVREYRNFATSFTTIRAADLREKIDAIYATDRYWPEPLIQINPRYQSGLTVEQLAHGGEIDARCAQIFRADGKPLGLYKHQQQALACAAQDKSYVVTTGTGSGKSLCFFIPIIDAVLKEKKSAPQPRTRAIVIYPMNALANSQMEELEKYLKNVEGERPVSFARYTGQEKDEERRRISEHPPDILLTNFMMLELLMTRQDELDRRVIGNCAGLRFLVLDELHTYRGRQGADVALLVRRVRERLAPKNLQCVGTSATMASGGTLEEKKAAVARVATKLFATEIPTSNVIVETLERITAPKESESSFAKALGVAIDKGIPDDVGNAVLRDHPLAVWVETELGIKFSELDQRWQRAMPRAVSEAVQLLALASKRDEAACREALLKLLLVSSRPENERGGKGKGDSFFAFKLHQFISGAGHAYATLEGPGVRTVTVDGQKFLPGAEVRRLYSVHFCRDCGQEYHPVTLNTDGGGQAFLDRDIDDSPPSQREDEEQEDDGDAPEIAGFITPRTPDLEFDDQDGDYPESWLEYDANHNPRLRRHYRDARARPFRAAPDGKIGTGLEVWFTRGKFRFCLQCKETQATSARDRTRLASLSAEGRSSATTVLVASALRWMHGEKSGLDPFKRKLLGFTDNRQDAALQSGHFNDFLFVSLLRAGFLRALDKAGDKGLRNDQLGEALQGALGFGLAALRREWLLEPDLEGHNLQEAERTLREVLSYRIWFDQRRGWRYTNPNLEQLELVAVEYAGLDRLVEDKDAFANAPDILKQASPAVRRRVYQAVLDHLRKWMAIRSDVLSASSLEQLVIRSKSRLRSPWGFGNDERARPSRWLLLTTPRTNRRAAVRDEDLMVRGGSRSALGRILRDSELWGTPESRNLESVDVDILTQALLHAARKKGLVTEEATLWGDTPGWRVLDSVIVFKKSEPEKKTNEFFRAFYSTLADLLKLPGHPLFGFEAREHTAQVEAERRQVREKRFRFDEKERGELQENEQQLRAMGEANRFLPVLFCSPTMELGVDISALNAVYLRNVPPTPANYAQRSGRAGRGGQAALVLTYCSSQGPHDQYFFREPKAMVHGEVRPPLIDLANRDLVESHLQAIWLACTQKPLDRSISQLLVLQDPKRPLRDEVRKPMEEQRVAQEAMHRIGAVLDMLFTELTPTDAPWYPGRDAFAQTVTSSAVARFESAFGRWRDLLAAAESQRDSARRVLDSYTANQFEKAAAKMRDRHAYEQINLLMQGDNSATSDFYTYRYLATEGFLPGYNFPRLPLMAYVPASQDGGGKQTYLQRPRFLALSEFGPRSLVYHEGRAYRVVRALLPPGHNEQTLATEALRICKSCGAGHFDETVSNCHGCGAPLGDADRINNVFRIENVATQPAERITANDEERQRQGFDLQTTFEWAVRDQKRDVRIGTASDGGEAVVNLTYGPGATITRVNKGLRRRRNQSSLGFVIDPMTGNWARNADEDDEDKSPDGVKGQRVVPSVRDRKNALLVRPSLAELEDITLATLQYALLRGIEGVFQLEESEILGEPMPTRAERNGFLLYEATEGGAGVLTRLVSEPGKIAEVARRALAVLHFKTSELPEDASGLRDEDKTSCVAACYRCLMSYYNQPEHDLLDRRDAQARSILLRLARSTTDTVVPRADALGEPAPTKDGRLNQWKAELVARTLPAPDNSPLSESGAEFRLVWREHNVVAVLDPLGAVAGKLADKGFEVISFEGDAWAEPFTRLGKALGR